MTTTHVDWMESGLCRQVDVSDAMFVSGKDQAKAKVLCRTCPVALLCLADALDNKTEFGVWGGLTERERRRLLKQHPNVTSWRRVLERKFGG
jgi:WhiB family redox-sensing transcriptional regulator